METKKFIYYQEEDMIVGWLEEYPDYRTQGETMQELEENLIDIYKDLSYGHIPCQNAEVEAKAWHKQGHHPTGDTRVSACFTRLAFPCYASCKRNRNGIFFIS